MSFKSCFSNQCLTFSCVQPYNNYEHMLTILENGKTMPRPQKVRWIGFRPQFTHFGPQLTPTLSAHRIILRIDELEALRLSDLLGLSQEMAAGRMNVSRATFGRIVARARSKVASALIYGNGISVGGSDVIFRRAAGGQGVSGRPHGRRGRGKGPL